MRALIFIIITHYMIFFADKAMAYVPDDCVVMSATTRALVHVKIFVSAKYGEEMSRDDMQQYIDTFYVHGEIVAYEKAVNAANWVYENLGSFNSAKQAQQTMLNECLKELAI